MTNDDAPPGTAADEGEFQRLSSQIIRDILDEQKVSCAVLAGRLASRGYRTTAADLEATIGRGDFSAAFLFRVMLAIGAGEIKFLP